ncbi:holo-ACP synthase [Acidocella sp.]|uniref:holo-ACP synthase n=1 Tax=Acidocella sp. TaxID=50710 RepID=UPI002628E7A2|nr:holo-ACP synthase [Acidocella sp.]
MNTGLIIGLGTDLCDIRRVENLLERHGERFTNRVFSAIERARSEQRSQLRAASYAKRFAAKEACAKALGTGFARGVFMSDLCVVNLPGGQPAMELSGGALERLRALTPEGYEARVLVSLTDEYPYAYAQVIISAAPPLSLLRAR